MPHFTTFRSVAVPADVAFAVAADVAGYASFLPLCERSVIRGPSVQEGHITRFQAELAVAYAKLNVRESFISRVVCDAAALSVTATSQDAPFRDMKTVWSITPRGSGCDVRISIDYSMRSMLTQFALVAAMDMAVSRMMAAFEARGTLVAAQRQALKQA
jgi:coenzyme Q-binding protein COQ10